MLRKNNKEKTKTNKKKLFQVHSLIVSFFEGSLLNRAFFSRFPWLLFSCCNTLKIIMKTGFHFFFFRFKAAIKWSVNCEGMHEWRNGYVLPSLKRVIISEREREKEKKSNFSFLKYIFKYYFYAIIYFSILKMVKVFLFINILELHCCLNENCGNN